MLADAVELIRQQAQILAMHDIDTDMMRTEREDLIAQAKEWTG